MTFMLMLRGKRKRKRSEYVDEDRAIAYFLFSVSITEMRSGNDRSNEVKIQNNK